MENQTPRKNIHSKQCATHNCTNKRRFYCFNEKISVWSKCRKRFYIDRDLEEIVTIYL